MANSDEILESLLNKTDEWYQNVKEKEEAIEKEKEEATSKSTAVGLHKANGNASLLDFIDMVGLIVENTMDDLGVQFMPDEKAFVIKQDPIEPIDHPIITFKIRERIHANKAGYKPRPVEVFTDTEADKSGTIYSERFASRVQFNIAATEYRAAWEVMDRFENLLLSYAEAIKGSGVADYYFIKQYRDEYYDTFRNTLSVLSLEYYVETEKLRVIFSENIKDIIAAGDVDNNNNKE